ncbi:MAG: 4-hydroxythreonine-4-phosphate dehydrogenase PdxA [Verrucomicrobiae bacterium]|jgi:4-hydroxythreonine-4-phosphate dehydrogenase|nr:4-hydroxythreonine-4-phosphate dehydrogenase PdxA [Verrucomicrobiae bacterium]
MSNRPINKNISGLAGSLKHPLIGLTVGDSAGVGPEILSSVLEKIEADPALLCGCSIKIIGNREAVNPGYPTRATSQEAMKALEQSARECLSGELAAVVTGPVNKHHLHEVGFAFPGQTEFFATRAGVSDFAMLLTGGALTVALVTAHVPLCDVTKILKASEIIRVGSLLLHFLKQRGLKTPRIAIAGLNPHAGERGDLGDEEEKIITPAVTRLTEMHSEALFVGPLSPDTVFWQASTGSYDAVLCMYHDQGLIPLKLHAFHEGVNVTLGLPFIRTSPDHGTAYEIAGKGIARSDSYLAAVQLAVKLVQGNILK